MEELLTRPTPPRSAVGAAACVGGVVRARSHRRDRRVGGARGRRWVLARRTAARPGRGVAADGDGHREHRSRAGPRPWPRARRSPPPRRRRSTSWCTWPGPCSCRACTGWRPMPGWPTRCWRRAALAPDAHADAINLAAPVHDGDRVYVPAPERRGRGAGRGDRHRCGRSRRGGDRGRCRSTRRASTSSMRCRAWGRRPRRRSSPIARRTARSPRSTRWPTCAASGRPSSRRSDRW